MMIVYDDDDYNYDDYDGDDSMMIIGMMVYGVHWSPWQHLLLISSSGEFTQDSFDIMGLRIKTRGVQFRDQPPLI